MAISLLHAFTSAVSDGADASVVRPSNWNAEHSLQMATARLLGRTTALTGVAEEISVGTGLTLATLTLGLDADLESWAGVTRATGFDTFAATPTSANLNTLVTDNTGTGALMFGTSPSITTDIRPATHDGASLGTAALGFSDLFLGTGGVITWGGVSTPDVTLTHAADTLRFEGAAGVVFNHTAALNGFYGTSDDVQFHNYNSSAPAFVGMYTWDAGTTHTSLNFYKSKSDTRGTHVAVTDNDALGILLAGGSDGGEFWESAGIQFAVDGTVANDVVPGEIRFRTSAAGESYTSARWVIRASGTLEPAASNTYAIGSSSLPVSDLFLGDGAVINWNAGDVTITHSADTLTIGGTTSVPVAGVVNVASGTATPASGSTSARLLFGTTAGFGIYYGSGAPTVSAAQGSIYLRSDGDGTGTRLYVNTTGSTTWTNFTSAT